VTQRVLLTLVSTPNSPLARSLSMFTRSTIAAALAATVAWAALAAPLAADDLPARPEEIAFAALRFEPPKASEFRHTLSNGVPVYLAPSKEFPLVNIAMTFKGGANLDPAEIVGLADATASMMRRGGTTTIKPRELDERLDFLAAQVGTRAGGWNTSGSLNCLTSNLDESFRLFLDILRNPGFDAEKLEIWKGEALEGMKQRNDDAGPILDREWDALLYGRDHFEARQMTKASLERITPEAMRGMHARIFHPGNVIVAVTGDFEPSDMLARLEKSLGAESGWQKGEPVPDPQKPSAEFKPGLYHVEKEIPQGKVYIGLRASSATTPTTSRCWSSTTSSAAAGSPAESPSESAATKVWPTAPAPASPRTSGTPASGAPRSRARTRPSRWLPRSSSTRSRRPAPAW
jgi:zinc protease